jgi:hypothetical protein
VSVRRSAFAAVASHAAARTGLGSSSSTTPASRRRTWSVAHGIRRADLVHLGTWCLGELAGG